MTSVFASGKPPGLHACRAAFSVAVIFLLTCAPLHAVEWLSFGPDGGDARSFGVDPTDHTHLYLGTNIGWLYETHNSGQQWKRLSRLGDRDDLVLDHILVDPANPKHLWVGVWVLGGTQGDLYSSTDGGVSWTKVADMAGQSIRSMTMAPSDPKIMVAGTLQGVFQTTDGGAHWRQISPAGSREIHEVESVAIDPKDPRVIYAGTWHLPWKTSDDGQHWTNVKDGIIDDSDVFSIIVDPKSPNVVYASACSGIYRSETGAEHFKKVQGIPSTARRTRVLKQDPEQLGTVFAGTTEGLFKTTDEGKTWLRTTGPEVIVNDVFVDPTDSKRVLLATDRGGVLASQDGGASFGPSNHGFVNRQVVSYAADRSRPAQIYIGVVNDKEWGGVFTSDNGGLTWLQVSTGLGGRDVFALVQAVDGTFVAGTSGGMFLLKDSSWQPANGVREGAAVPRGKARRSGGKPAGTHRGSSPGAGRQHEQPHVSSTPLEGGVYALAQDGDQIYAISSRGLLKSVSSGQSWATIPNLPPGEYRNVAAANRVVAAATLNSLAVSKDDGGSWSDVPKPDGLSQIGSIAIDDDGGLWAGGREGVFVRHRGSSNWQALPNLRVGDVNSLWFDRAGKQVLVTTNTSGTLAYGIQLPDLRVHTWNTGWHMRWIRPIGDHLIGATLFDGVVVQPRMIASPFAGGH